MRDVIRKSNIKESNFNVGEMGVDLDLNRLLSSRSTATFLSLPLIFSLTRVSFGDTSLNGLISVTFRVLEGGEDMSMYLLECLYEIGIVF